VIFRPSGTAALLVELDDLDEVLGYYAALVDERPEGVLDIVPAARTILLSIDRAVADLPDVERVVRQVTPRHGQRSEGDLVELPVTYDGEDLSDVASLLSCDVEEVVRQHTSEEWTVAFCGFAPGFGYMTSTSGTWNVPRRSSPRTKVPPGSVALAGEFSGVYPRESPGGWQLIGRTAVPVFDLDRDPAALLRPSTRVRFVDEGSHGRT
jgi:KipI family sensor histidine kinase inhibitor